MTQNTKKWTMTWNSKKRDLAKAGPLANILEVSIRHMSLVIYSIIIKEAWQIGLVHTYMTIKKMMMMQMEAFCRPLVVD